MMATVFDVPAEKLIKELAKVLKEEKKITIPEWGQFVKSGGNREKMPEDGDWWYIRSASILRKIRIHGPLGVGELEKIYGGKKNRGHKPERRRGASGAIIRHILKQLEDAGLVVKTDKGRVTSPKGVSFLDKISNQIQRAV
jgi:small subunit ribosomal protein S19e